MKIKNSYNKPTNKWTSDDKFYAVMETGTLTETELAEYCKKTVNDSKYADLAPSQIVPKLADEGEYTRIWTWDITWLNAAIKGEYFKLYLIVDMLSQGTSGTPLVLHSDNGSSMKAATFQATLEKLGI